MAKSLYKLVGMKHRGTQKIVGAWADGKVVTLVREPSNQYDANAVQVWADHNHVGFIAAKDNPQLAAFMDARPGNTLVGVFRPNTAERWPMIEVEEETQ